MDYGHCYNSTGSRCSGGPQPGVVALRNVILILFPIFGSLGIYNCRPVRGGGSLSTHGEGRGWDCKCSVYIPAQKEAGDALAALLVSKANLLGIQRIIWNRRQWDAQTRVWRDYHGVAPHTDHLHIELCWASANGPLRLTESYVRSVLVGEPEMTPAQEEKLDKAIDLCEKVLASVGSRYKDGPTLQKALVKYGDDDGDPVTPSVPMEHLNILEDRIDTIDATLARIEEALANGG